jgi:hypothetical protein
VRDGEDDLTIWSSVRSVFGGAIITAAEPTRSSTSGNASCRVRLLDRPNPMLYCFMASIIHGDQLPARHIGDGVLQTAARHR